MASEEKKAPGTPAEVPGRRPAQGRKAPGEKNEESAMAELSRRFKANPFVFVGTIVVLVIIIIAFVFVPAIVPEQSQGLDLNFGSYNKTPISYVEGNYFYRVQQNLVQQYQSSLDNNNFQATLYRIWREAFESTVVQTGILDEMKSAGYTAPQDVVDRAVALLPDFQENGAFSAAKYRQLDNNTRMALWRQTRDGIAMEHYVSDWSGLRVPAQEKTFISAMASPQRRFDMVSFPTGFYPDSEVAAYAQANPALFRLTHLSKITVYSNEREARQILESIQNQTETFEDAAKNKSGDMYAQNSGDMGSRMAFEFLTEIPDEQAREEILSLEPGTLSRVIPLSDTSWALFRCEEAVRPADTADSVTIEKIRNYILTYERGRVEDWLTGEAERFIARVKASDFDSAIMDRGGITKNTIGPFPINYGNAALFASASSLGIAELSNVGTNERFWETAFSTPLKTPSEPLVLGNSVVVLYPLEETAMDSENGEFIEMYYSYWLSTTAEQDFRSFFMNNEKLDDRFEDIFWRIFVE